MKHDATQAKFSEPEDSDLKSSNPSHSSLESGTSLSEQRRRELADFLRLRREKLKPELMGLAQGTRRRTPGLRREEVAELAGVGTTWYTWLEQARDIQPSSEVLSRLGKALRLNSAEMRHLFTLAGKAPIVEITPETDKPTESMKRFLDEAVRVPGILLGARWDILHMNAQAESFFTIAKDLPKDRRNWLYLVFCKPDTRLGAKEWEAVACKLVADFRASLSDVLDCPWVQELVQILKAESPDFERLWREHQVSGSDVAILELQKPDGNFGLFEKVMFKPAENERMRYIVYSPYQKS